MGLAHQCGTTRGQECIIISIGLIDNDRDDRHFDWSMPQAPHEAYLFHLRIR